MKSKDSRVVINTISDLHQLLGLNRPQHPLISLVSFDDVNKVEHDGNFSIVLNLYTISLKKNEQGKLKYGQGYYDFDEGVLGMTSPGQMLSSNNNGQYKVSGWWLLFHPDFLKNYPLAKAIQKMGFFSYDVNEALHLSEREDLQLEKIFQNIAVEYENAIDIYSQDLMIAQLEVLLNYVKRYYGRQFITRKTINQPVVAKFENLLNQYIQTEYLVDGLPTVKYFSDRLNVSPHYLSDLLRKYTGQNTQQHIHSKLIEKAKAKLSTTDLTVGEIAYELGFEHPQSFNKLFKRKENMTPIDYRQLFN